MRQRVSGPVESRYTTVVKTSMNNGPFVPYGAYPWSCIDFKETIYDEPRIMWVKLKTGERVKAYKAVNHTRHRTTVAGGDVTWRVGPNSVAQTNATAIWLYEQCHWTTYGGDWSHVPMEGARDKFYDHWDVCKPSLNTRANLAVFLYELRDLKRMFEVIPIRHLYVKDIRMPSYRKPVEGWRDALRYANDQHLNYNFGWKPFIRDIKNVFGGLTTLDRRLGKFLREENKLLRRRWKDDFTVSETVRTRWSIYERVSETSLTVRDSSSFMFSYDVPDYGQSELRARAILDTIGLKATAANIWAVLPWSFVVDWFFDVGGYLDQYSTDWLQPWVDFIQGCKSFKVEGTVVENLNNVSYGGSAPIGTLTLKHYHRTPGLPVFSAATDPLSADKIRLLTSLGASLVL